MNEAQTIWTKRKLLDLEMWEIAWKEEISNFKKRIVA